MTVPGVNVIVAATFLAAIGDVRRFRGARQLVGYLGLDPRVRQSGAGPAKHGRISKQGSAPARYALVEASWSVVRQPGSRESRHQNRHADAQEAAPARDHRRGAQAPRPTRHLGRQRANGPRLATHWKETGRGCDTGARI
jgi:transposase